MADTPKTQAEITLIGDASTKYIYKNDPTYGAGGALEQIRGRITSGTSLIPVENSTGENISIAGSAIATVKEVIV